MVNSFLCITVEVRVRAKHKKAMQHNDFITGKIVSFDRIWLIHSFISFIFNVTVLNSNTVFFIANRPVVGVLKKHQWFQLSPQFIIQSHSDLFWIYYISWESQFEIKIAFKLTVLELSESSYGTLSTFSSKYE